MVGTAPPLCLLRQKPNGIADLTMNLGKGEITAPHYNTGLDDEISSSWSGNVFLDILFYRTGLSEIGLSAVGRPKSQFPIMGALSAVGFLSRPSFADSNCRSILFSSMIICSQIA
jgi:hypothetical protein